MTSRSYKPGDPYYVADWPPPYSWDRTATIESSVALALHFAHLGAWERAYWYLEVARVRRNSADWPKWTSL